MIAPAPGSEPTPEERARWRAQVEQVRRLRADLQPRTIANGLQAELLAKRIEIQRAHRRRSIAIAAALLLVIAVALIVANRP